MRRRERSPGLTTFGVNCLTRPMLVLMARLVVAAVVLLRFWSVVMAPAGMVLVLPPVTVEVTLTLIWQLALAARETPSRLTWREFATAVTTPPGQVVEGAGLGVSTQPLLVPPALPPTVK